MRQRTETAGQRGFALTEIIISLGLVALLTTLLAVSLDGLRRFTHYQWTRQRCLAAAQAQLDSLRLAGRSLDDGLGTELWPGIEITVRCEPGRGDWQGLIRIHVRAEAPSFNRRARVDCVEYVAPGVLRGGGDGDA